MRQIGLPCLLAVCVLAVGSRAQQSQPVVSQQDVAPKDRALFQMRRIVERIRQCPDGGTERFGDANVAIIHRRPPRVLEWDVLVSQSLRAPFQGYVRFDLPVDVQETDEAKRSKELNREYELFIWPAASKFVEYRYEFDLGSDIPELRRALIKLPTSPTGSADFKLYEPRANSEGSISCWDAIATSPALDSEKRSVSGAPAGPRGDSRNEVQKTASVPSAALPQSKVVSFAWADGNGVFLGSPQWTDDWVKKNAKKFPTVSFSQTPIAGAENFLVVLSSSTSVLSGFQPVARINTTSATSDISGRGTLTDNSGSNWDYRYEGTATTTTTTMTRENVPYTIESQTLYASAYGGPLDLLVARRSETIGREEGGDPASAVGYNLGQLARRIRLKTRLLDGIINEIAKLP